MKKIFFPVFILFFVINSAVSAQKNDNNVIVSNFDEHRPAFPGGEAALLRFIAENTQYPLEALTNKIEGKVFIQFVIEKDGSVSNVKLLRGIGSGCNEEAIRVVKMLPKFKPGMQNGQAVRVQYNVPIMFKLDEALKGTPAKSVEVDSIYTKPTQPAVFQGSERETLIFLAKNVRYPAEDRENNRQGTVKVAITVEKDGSVSTYKIVKSISPTLDAETLRCIKLLEKATPATFNGKNVRSVLTLPLSFKIERN